MRRIEPGSEAPLRHFATAYGAEVYSEPFRLLVVTRSSPPSTRAEAWQCAIEVLGFDDGPDESLTEFTSAVLAGHPWVFWWD